MVLSDRYGGKPRPSILRRTIIYIVSFGLGSLAIAITLSFVSMAIADSVLPDHSKGRKSSAASKKKGDDDELGSRRRPGRKRAGSKARRGRGKATLPPAESDPSTESQPPTESEE